MALKSGDMNIIKIMDNDGHMIANLSVGDGDTEIINQIPFVFNADGANLSDYTIYGNTGGVGDFNSTTNKYDIPITIHGKNLFDKANVNLVHLYPKTEGNANGTATADSVAYSLIVPVEANTTYCFSVLNPSANPVINKMTIAGYATLPQDGTTATFVDEYFNRSGNYEYNNFYTPNTTSYLLIFLWNDASYTQSVVSDIIDTANLQLEKGAEMTSYSAYTVTNTTLSLNAPIQGGQKVSQSDTNVNITTVNGLNEIVVNTNIQPKQVRVKGDIDFVRCGNPETYYVTYYDDSGNTIINREYVEKGHNAAGLSINPTKTSTAQYDYTFIGWTKTQGNTTADADALTNIVTNRSLYAVFEQTVRTYTVYFYNEATLLQTVQNVPYGGSATYTGTEPTKTDYEFTGWNPQPTNIIADTSCYAQFEQRIQGLITDSWDVISARSNAGTAQNYYSVGDCKPIYLNGTMGTLALDTTLYVYILGFDHNSAREGTGITFGGFKTNYGDSGIDVALCDANYGSYNTSGSKWFNMNHRQGSISYGHNFGGWKGCDMRYDILGSTDTAPSGYGATATTANVGYDATSTCATSPVANTLMSCLPNELRNVMKPVTKYTDNKGNDSNVKANVTTSVDYLPLLSEYEVQGARTYANQYEKNYQAQYAYYASGNSKVKYSHAATSSSVSWWVRSPYYYDSVNFCGVGAIGYAANSGSRDSRGVAPAFLI